MARNNYVRLYDVISHDVINLPKTHYRMARVIFISYGTFLGDDSSKHVASILSDKDSESVKYL